MRVLAPGSSASFPLGRMRALRRGAGRELLPALWQMLAILPVFAVSAALAWVGPGFLARLAFIAGGVGVAAWYWRRSPWLYLTAVFWFWTLTPFARRLIDYRAGFDPTSIMLATPNVMSVFMVIDIARSRTLFCRREAIWAVFALLAVAYGLSVSLVQGQVYPGAVASMDWLIPMLYYFYVLEHAGALDHAEVPLRGFLLLNGLVVVGYGLFQFWQPPPWDVAWALASGMENPTEFKTAGAFRVFGTLNETGVFAFWLATLIVLSLHFRSLLSLVLLPAAALLLLLTNDRSVTVGAVVCLAVAALLGGARISRGLLTTGAGLAALAIVFGNLNPAVVDHLAMRFSSLDTLQNDNSALVRESIWDSTPRLISEHPLGMGIGAFGRGAVVADDAGGYNIDFGILAVYLSLGWVAGTVYLVSIGATVVLAILGAQRCRGSAPIAFALAAFGMLLQMVILNVIGFSGAILWLCAGMAAAYDIRRRTRRPADAIAATGAIR